MTKTEETVTIHVTEEGGQRTLEAELTLDVSVEAVWKALTEAGELRNWFPLDAAVEPGVGGTIQLSWDDAFPGLVMGCTVDRWEPNRRLRTTWPHAAAEEGTPLPVVDYLLEGRGGSTVLRLVHSGFSTARKWDDEFDATRRGWSFELRSLKHYLEHHRGVRRYVAKARREIGIPVAEAWKRMMSSRGLLRQGSLERLGEGDRYAITTAAGDRLEGEVRLTIEPTDFAATVENQRFSLLRLLIERCGGPMTVSLWLSAYGVPQEELTAIESRWQGLLDGLFTES